MFSNHIERRQYIAEVQWLCSKRTTCNNTTGGVLPIITEYQEKFGRLRNAALVEVTDVDMSALLIYVSNTAVLLNCNVDILQFGALLHGPNFIDVLYNDYCCKTGDALTSRDSFEELVSLSEVMPVTLLLLPGLNVFYHFKARTFIDCARVSGEKVAGSTTPGRMRKKMKVADALDLPRIDEMLDLLIALVPLPLHWLRLDLNNDPLEYANCVVDSVDFVIRVELDATVTTPPLSTAAATTSHTSTSSTALLQTHTPLPICVPTYHAQHLSPYSMLCPLIEGKYPRRIYQQVIRDSNRSTMKAHTRQYVSGDTFFLSSEAIAEQNILVTEPNGANTNGLDVCVTVLDHDNKDTGIHSVIKVRFAPDDCNLVKEAVLLGHEMKRNPKIAQVRDTDGSDGCMFAFGLRNSERNAGLGEFVATTALSKFYADRKHFVLHFSEVAAELFPVEWSTICNSDACQGLQFVTSFTRNKLAPDGCPSALYGTIDYGSAQHVDIRDASGSVLLLTNSDKLCRCQVNKDGVSYFVFVNVLVTSHNGHVYRGVAICVQPGTMVYFDGRCLHHGTTNKCCPCHTYGFLMAANANTHNHLLKDGKDYSNLGLSVINGPLANDADT